MTAYLKAMDKKSYSLRLLCHTNEKRSVLFGSDKYLYGKARNRMICIYKRTLIFFSFPGVRIPHKGSACTDENNSLVLSSVAEGLMNFHLLMKDKTLETNVRNVFYDDLPSKQASWESAIQTVKILLNLHSEIVTGLSEVNVTQVILEDNIIGGF